MHYHFYEFVLWPNCSWDISCPGDFCPETGPRVPWQHHCLAWWPTGRLPFSKRVFIGIFSLVVCLRALYHHIRLAYSNKYRVSLVLFPRKTEHSLMCTIGRIDYGLKIVYSFRPDTPPHYHLHAELLISIEHIGENIEESVNAYWVYFYRI